MQEEHDQAVKGEGRAKVEEKQRAKQENEVAKNRDHKSMSSSLA